MKRIEYCKFPETLNHVISIGTKDMTIINTGFAYPKNETEQFSLSRLEKSNESKEVNNHVD